MYKKEEALLKYYNNHPYGGTTIADEQSLQILIDLAEVKIKNGSKVLDLGCASGVMADNVRKLYEADVTGVDFAHERIQIGKEERPKVKYILKDIHTYVEVTNDRYDLIMLFDTLEHLEDPKKLVDNAKKILAKNGKILAVTPLNFPYEAHIQVFKDKNDFDDRLRPDESFNYGRSVIAIWK